MIVEIFKYTLLFLSIIGGIVAAGIGIIKSIDYIEDNVYAVKEKIQTIVYTICALHIVFLFIGMPIWHILFSLSIQYAFHTFFATYPIIRPEDPKFLFGVIGSLVNHFLLIRVFILQSSSILTVVFSFIVIWVTPFCFFFTMSAADDIPFARSNASAGRHTKTFAGMALDWVMSMGKKTLESKE